MWMMVVAVAGLLMGLWAALSYFWGTMAQESYRHWLLVSMVVWFVFAILANRKTG
jgi:hypothetical protein